MYNLCITIKVLTNQKFDRLLGPPPSPPCVAYTDPKSLLEAGLARRIASASLNTLNRAAYDCSPTNK